MGRDDSKEVGMLGCWTVGLSKFGYLRLLSKVRLVLYLGGDKCGVWRKSPFVIIGNKFRIRSRCATKAICLLTEAGLSRP